ncbi:MAG: DNA gyrase inhibitor YacG [Burkholderiales bacterium]|nr:DNA gyrase inhibitor YacG [Burkholderiales bacterium]
MSTATVVACPRCGTATTFAPANAWRPFCSERCKLIDLGHWASERYRVPDASVPPDDDEAAGTT